MKAFEHKERSGRRAAICCASALGVLMACQATPAPPPRCTTPFSQEIQVSAESLVVRDTTLLGVEGWLVDPEPLRRGDHPVRRLWRDPESCAWEGGWYAWTPRAGEGNDAVEPERGGGDIDSPTGHLRAILLIGEDTAAEEDATRWSQTVRPLSPDYTLRRAPTRVDALDSVAAGCRGVGPKDTVLLVATGAGSPAGGGALILGPEAVGYRSLMAHTRHVCADAGLLVIVLDGSYVPRLDAEWSSDGPPVILWRASDEVATDAPRLTPHGGGLLSAALTSQITERVEGDCMAGATSTPWEWLRVFEGEDALRQRMLALRWQEVDDLNRVQREAVHPTASHRFAAALESGLPTELRLSVGELSPSQRCLTDTDCAARVAECGLEGCMGLACLDGRCVEAVNEGAPCNDGSVCTADDVCASGGFCRGVSLDCDDGSPCTTDSCLHDEGCVHSPRPGASCDDEDLCTTHDHCAASGACVGAPIDCTDSNPCTDDWCDAVAGCLVQANHAPCDDESACTTPDYCEDGVCRGAPRVCIDDDPCTVDACDLASGCVNPTLPDGSLCDDGDGCTQDDRCQSGICGGLDAGCDDGWGCSLDSCVNGLCSHLPEPGNCITDQGCIPVGAHPLANPCVVCQSTDLLGPTPQSEGTPCPDDGITCTADLCEGGACVHTNMPGTCHRADGSCVSVGEPITPCLTCVDTGVGAPMPEGTPCDDTSACTVDDSCDGAGACGSIPIPCCPIATGLVCGASVEGSTSDDVASAAVDTWSCLPTPYPAPERAHLFRAPCDGEVIFHLEGQPGQLLFLIRGPPSHAEAPSTQCLTGQCDTYTTAGLTQWMFTEQEYLLVVDGLEGSSGDYTLEVLCDCPQPAP
jgi:hypothetical protein